MDRPAHAGYESPCFRIVPDAGALYGSGRWPDLRMDYSWLGGPECPNANRCRGVWPWERILPIVSSCVGVGYYQAANGLVETLVEQWNGEAWTVVPSPNPSGATVSTMSGVSCTAATTCTAVGYDDNSAGIDVPLIERLS
jgi:hypothetical protein